MQARIFAASLVALAVTISRDARADEAASEACAASGDAAVKCATEVQNAAEMIPDFIKLRPSDPPAFTLLGVAPTDIQRPTTPRTLALSLSKFVDASGDILIPDNIAIELAPFWLLPADGLELADYLEGGSSSLWQNFSISVATRSRDREVVDAMGASVTMVDKDLAIGARTQLTGKTLFDQEQKCNVVDAKLADLARTTAVGPATTDTAARDAVLAANVTLGHAVANDTAESTPETRATIDAAKRAVEVTEAALREVVLLRKQETVEMNAKTLEELGEEVISACVEAGSARTWVVEAAGAVRWQFPAGVVDDGQIDGRTAWLTAAYNAISGLDVVGFGRYVGEKPDGDNWIDALDIGVQAVLARGKYAASFEAIVRFVVDEPDTSEVEKTQYRVAAGFDYELDEGKWLTFAFGKDFADGEAGSLFSLANLSYAFGDPKVVPKKE